MDINQRADNAQHVINEYAIVKGNVYGGESDDELISDLLTDLRHLCKREGIDFDHCTRMAEMHFSEEA